jgi:hypothetical protein
MQFICRLCNDRIFPLLFSIEESKLLLDQSDLSGVAEYRDAQSEHRHPVFPEKADNSGFDN